MILPTTIVVATKDQVFCDLGGEAAILSLASGIYFGLNPVGAFVWSLLQEPTRVERVCDAVMQEYDVDPARCDADVRKLLEDLLEQNLIEVRDGPVEATK